MRREIKMMVVTRPVIVSSYKLVISFLFMAAGCFYGRAIPGSIHNCKPHSFGPKFRTSGLFY